MRFHPTLTDLRLGAIIILFLFLKAEARAQKDEYSVKAAALSQFAHYTTWPRDAFAEKGSPVVIGILGADPFGAKLDAACRGVKTASGRALVIRKSRSAADLADCHIVFVCGSEQRRLGGIIPALGAGTLVVGDWEGIAASGGAIGMALKDGKLDLTFNPDAAKRGGLKLSARLLRLGRSVR